MLPLLLGMYLNLVRNCARLLIVATPVLKAAVKSTKVMSHGSNIRDLIIAHVISANAQISKQLTWRTLGRAGHAQSMWPAGKRPHINHAL